MGEVSTATDALVGLQDRASLQVRVQQNHEGQEKDFVVAPVGGALSEEQVCQLQESGRARFAPEQSQDCDGETEAKIAQMNGKEQADLYDEPPTDQDPREGGPAKPEEGEGQTATIPKSLVPGAIEIGEEIVLKVEKVLENELLVSYAPSKPSEPAGEAASASPRDGTDEAEPTGSLYD